MQADVERLLNMALELQEKFKASFAKLEDDANEQ